MEYPFSKEEMSEMLFNAARDDSEIRQPIIDLIFEKWSEDELAEFLGIEAVLTAEEQLSRYEEAKADRKNGK